MNPEPEVIEAMIKALLDSLCQNDADMKAGMRDAIRAAAERGWVLARPKGGFECEIKIAEMDEYLRGWYDALKSIETIEIEKEQSK